MTHFARTHYSIIPLFQHSNCERSELSSASDIPINVYATYAYWDGDIYSNWLLHGQILFGIFLFATVPIAWKRVGARGKKEDVLQ